VTARKRRSGRATEGEQWRPPFLAERQEHEIGRDDGQSQMSRGGDQSRPSVIRNR